MNANDCLYHADLRSRLLMSLFKWNREYCSENRLITTNLTGSWNVPTAVESATEVSLLKPAYAQ